MKTPITLITGPLGSGKTTLLRHLLASTSEKMALLINEFGEIAIDSKVVEGKAVRVAELSGGCVCCSLLGDFEAAVQEILETVNPARIVVETTGLAEPEALIFDIEDTLTQTRLDGVVTVVDADALIRFPSWGQTTRMQLQAADLILLNKTDLVSAAEAERLEKDIRRLTPAPLLRTLHSQVDPALLFGIGSSKAPLSSGHRHQPEVESFTFTTSHPLERQKFEQFANSLPPSVYRAKGFVRFADGSALFNFVNGRWSLEAAGEEETALVFIGPDISRHKTGVLADLQRCLQLPA